MFLVVSQIIVTLLLIIAIMLQMQGSGLSTSFGGSGEFFRSKQSIDKILVTGTVILAILFALLSILLLIPR